MSRRSLTLPLAILFLALILPVVVAATPPPAELLAAGRVDEAIGALTSRLQQAPDDAEAHYLLMRAYFGLQRWDDAINEGQRAVALMPNNSEYHLWLGRTYGEKADHSSWVTAVSMAKKARAEFERAVQLDGRNVEARTDLAEFYVEAPGFLGGGKDKAQAQADQIFKLGNESAALWVRAKIAEADKNFALAEMDLRSAIQTSQNHPDSILSLASFYRRRGRMSEVEDTVNKAVAADKQRHSYYDAAELLYRAGRNFQSATQLLREYISAGNHRPSDPPIFQAHFLLGTILEKLGDRRSAADQYRASLSLASSFGPAQSALKRVQ